MIKNERIFDIDIIFSVNDFHDDVVVRKENNHHPNFIKIPLVLIELREFLYFYDERT